MPVFDASSIVYAWDNYPIGIFPTLWDWMGAEVKSGNIVMSEVALGEVKNVSPACRDWLDKNEISNHDVTNQIVRAAQGFKALIGVVDDDYHPKGVGENDLLIIATAQALGVSLVSDEELQTDLPNDMRRYKIPAVCKLTPVSVTCESYLEFLKQSGQRF